LGSKNAVRELLKISSQRLSDAARGGMPIRSERVIRLALVAGVEPTEALRAGGHESLATLLEEAYLPRLNNITTEGGGLLALLRSLSADSQRIVRDMARVLASQPTGTRTAVPSDAKTDRTLGEG
jgi:hypothetical protein